MKNKQPRKLQPVMASRKLFPYVYTRGARGFTLLEILIALFVFSILSLLLSSALRTVLRTESAVSTHATRLREMQKVLLILSRDIEQAVNRPIQNPKDEEDRAFIGTPKSFIFTHLGTADVLTFNNPGMKRTRYHWEGTTLWRTSWQSLDQPPQSKPQLQAFLQGVNDVRFQYLDNEGRFHDQWPIEGKEDQILPIAVNIQFTMAEWGKLRQLYVINAEKDDNHAEEEKESPSTE